MSLELLAYPFLFLAIYIESFVLITFLSGPARAARGRALTTLTPSVAVIVPCWNEAATIAGTCDSLLALDYPKDKLEIILVDDGSTDATPEIMRRFAHHPQVRVVSKENGGKHTALNAGIALTSAELVGCLDADSFVEPDALREIVGSFEDPKVMATTAAMSVHQPNNILQHMQHAEYALGIALRHTFASINGLYVTPGPFSFYRRAIIEKLGGFRHGHQTEDMEMALRIQRAGYGIENAPRARVYTKAPATLAKLVKQRTRWVRGFLRNTLGEYRDMVGNRRFGILGMLVLPVAVLTIGSGILLFAVMLSLSLGNLITAVDVRAGIPFSYAFLPHGQFAFDWFYLPATFFFLLIAAVLLASATLIIIGKRLSKTPGNIALGIFSYTFLYGLIVPLWLIRATSDVAFGKNRDWRS